MSPNSRPRLRLQLAILAVAAVILSACGGDDGGSGRASYGGGGAAEAPTEAVEIVSPADGAMVESPVRVEMAAEGIRIEPAGESVAGAGHFHLMIDIECVEPGDSIPFDEGHLHLGDGSSEASLFLEPGEYTVCLQAGDGVHTALDLTDTVRFTVTG